MAKQRKTSRKQAKTARSRGKTSRGRAKTARPRGKTASARRKISEVNFKSRARGSVWQPHIDAIESLKVDECYIVPVPKGETPRQIQNRITSALNRFGDPKKPGKGFRYRKRTTEYGNVAVCKVRA